MAMVRPRLDHFVGRRAMTVMQDEENLWDWTIILEGKVEIHNEDQQRVESPDVVLGMLLTTVIQSEAETRLVFTRPDASGQPDLTRQIQLEITPTLHTISAPGYEQQGIHPQWPEELEEILPPDPSPDRVAAGPMPFEETGPITKPTVVKVTEPKDEPLPPPQVMPPKATKKATRKARKPRRDDEKPNGGK